MPPDVLGVDPSRSCCVPGMCWCPPCWKTFGKLWKLAARTGSDTEQCIGSSVHGQDPEHNAVCSARSK